MTYLDRLLYLYFADLRRKISHSKHSTTSKLMQENSQCLPEIPSLLGPRTSYILKTFDTLKEFWHRKLSISFRHAFMWHDCRTNPTTSLQVRKISFHSRAVESIAWCKVVVNLYRLGRDSKWSYTGCTVSSSTTQVFRFPPQELSTKFPIESCIVNGDTYTCIEWRILGRRCLNIARRICENLIIT